VPLPPTPAGYDRTETVELSHGRYEQRITTTTGNLDWFTRSWKWHGLRSITEIRRLTHRNGPEEALSEEIHYYLSSLPPEAERLAKVVRDHWAVENTCHHVLDTIFGKDHCQVQDANAAQNLSLLREMAAKAIRDEPTKRSIASKRKRACLDPAFRLKMLLAGIASLLKAYALGIWRTKVKRRTGLSQLKRKPCHCGCSHFFPVGNPPGQYH